MGRAGGGGVVGRIAGGLSLTPPHSSTFSLLSPLGRAARCCDQQKVKTQTQTHTHTRARRQTHSDEKKKKRCATLFSPSLTHTGERRARGYCYFYYFAAALHGKGRSRGGRERRQGRRRRERGSPSKTTTTTKQANSKGRGSGINTTNFLVRTHTAPPKKSQCASLPLPLSVLRSGDPRRPSRKALQSFLLCFPRPFFPGVCVCIRSHLIHDAAWRHQTERRRAPQNTHIYIVTGASLSCSLCHAHTHPHKHTHARTSFHR
jgi:hypothetical protein